MLVETTYGDPVPPLHPTDSIVPSGDAPEPRPWCPDGPQAEVVALGDRIAELSARIQAATWELLELIRQFDKRDGWAGCTSCAEWLGWRTGLAPGAAREHVRVARALADLPKLSDAMRSGRVSYSKVRAISRVATPETEDDLLNVALSGTAAHVEKIVRVWRRVDRLAEQAEDRRRHDTRSLRTWVDEDGMVVVRGRLSPEVGAVVRRALEAACDQARGADGAAADGGADAKGATGADAGGGRAAETSEPSLAQRQADALGMIAECALSAELDRGTAGDRYQVVVHVDADALTDAPEVHAGTSAKAASESRRLGDGPRVRTGTSTTATSGSEQRGNGRSVPAGASAKAGTASEQHAEGSDVPTGTHTIAASESERRDNGPDVPAGTRAATDSAAGPPDTGPETRAGATRHGDTREARRSPDPCPGPRPAASGSAVRGQTVLDEAGGIHVSAETARRLACDAATVRMPHGPGGEILDVGRRTRTISPALRRALRTRDRQCRFPGCRNARCDAHHVRHWADGGATALDNLVLLCRRHHRAVHEEGFRITLDATGDVEFVRPDGRPLPEAPAAPAWTGEPLAPVTAQLERNGVTIGPDTATPDWRGEKLDLDWVIHVLWRPQPQEATPEEASA